MDDVLPVIVLHNLKLRGSDRQVSDHRRARTPFAFRIRIVPEYCLLKQPLLPLGLLFVSFEHRNSVYAKPTAGRHCFIDCHRDSGCDVSI
jgi:hypothetical protein